MDPDVLDAFLFEKQKRLRARIKELERGRHRSIPLDANGVPMAEHAPGPVPNTDLYTPVSQQQPKRGLPPAGALDSKQPGAGGDSKQVSKQFADVPEYAAGDNSLSGLGQHYQAPPDTDGNAKFQQPGVAKAWAGRPFWVDQAERNAESQGKSECHPACLPNCHPVCLGVIDKKTHYRDVFDPVETAAFGKL